MYTVHARRGQASQFKFMWRQCVATLSEVVHHVAQQLAVCQGRTATVKAYVT